MELAEYGRIAEVEDGHWWYRNVREMVREMLRDDLGRDQLLLDAGCGPGGNTAWMKEHGRVVGLDNAHAAVRFLQQRWPDTMPIQGSISELPFRDEAFDIVTTITVVTCVPDDALAVRELARVLRPGGALFLIEPAFPSLRRAHDITGHSLRRYRRPQLSDMVRSAGLRVERATYAYSYLAPAAAVLHFVERGKVADASGDKGSDTRRRWLDWLFGPLAAAERRWLARRDVPVGTSVVVTASKT
jgi:ubiquinone/menaquinone biosynthesis C-methylase UbiE